MIIFPSGYTLPSGDEPLTHARIAHSLNWISGGTATASGTATDYFEDGPDNSLSYERWKPDSLPATWEYDFGSAQDIDYCVIAAHTMGASGNTLEVQYDDGGWTDLITATAITDDSPIFVIFPEETFQTFRIRITNGTAPEIGVVKFGKAMQMERPLYGGHSPLPLSRVTALRANNSETGQFLGRAVQRKFLSTAYSWQHLSSAFIRSDWVPFQKAIEAEPFVIAWRPATFQDVGYCQVDAVPIPQAMGIRDLYSVEMQVRGLAYD